MNVIDLKDYKNSLNYRINGFLNLNKVGVSYPSPVKIVTHNAFKKYKKNRSFDKKTLSKLKEGFEEITNIHKDKGIIARRAYIVPGIKNPPGPHSSKITKYSQLVSEIKSIFDFAIDNKFDRKGAEITAFFHPLINPVFPLVGGCITPSKDNPEEVVIEAIYGMDEGVQAFPHDNYAVNIKRDNIVGKYILRKTKCLQFTDNFKVKTIEIPEEYRNSQVISDLKILIIAKDFEKIINLYGPSRVEFDIIEDKHYFIECTPFTIEKSKNKDLDSSGKILAVKKISDIEKTTTNGKIIFIDHKVIEKREWDILTTLAYNLSPNSIVLFPGTVTTAHAATIFREKGHILVYVRNQTFNSGELVRIRLKGNHLVAEKENPERIPHTLILSKRVNNYKSFIGNKAQKLFELYSRNYNIPKSFVITSQAFTEFLSSNGLLERIRHMTLSRSKEELCELAKEIKNQIKKSRIPNDLKKGILEAFNSLKEKSVAVRSSANCEDSEKTSFAGQFATFLKVDKKSLLTKIKEVWASVFTKNAVIYSYANNIPIYSIQMSVLVMKMVDAQKAGVMFTKNMNTNNKNEIVIEATTGLGDKVVDGTVEPDRVLVKRAGLQINRRNRLNILTDSEIRKLTKLGIAIEKISKTPQDIEWAIEEGKIWVLQTRPITT
ncbi:MAG: PEP/pyruvate-binding domain-containing protein [Patescibacteria group bacterium]|nr:hypothetical protein [Patescibacteria group bacterium]